MWQQASPGKLASCPVLRLAAAAQLPATGSPGQGRTRRSQAHVRAPLTSLGSKIKAGPSAGPAPSTLPCTSMVSLRGRYRSLSPESRKPLSSSHSREQPPKALSPPAREDEPLQSSVHHPANQWSHLHPPPVPPPVPLWSLIPLHLASIPNITQVAHGRAPFIGWHGICLLPCPSQADLGLPGMGSQGWARITGSKLSSFLGSWSRWRGCDGCSLAGPR